MRLIVDPPSGWRYGFPKECPEEIMYDLEKFKQWIVEEGYPDRQSELDLALRYSRYWYEE